MVGFLTNPYHPPTQVPKPVFCPSFLTRPEDFVPNIRNLAGLQRILIFGGVCSMYLGAEGDLHDDARFSAPGQGSALPRPGEHLDIRCARFERARFLLTWSKKVLDQIATAKGKFHEPQYESAAGTAKTPSSLSSSYGFNRLGRASRQLVHTSGSGRSFDTT